MTTDIGTAVPAAAPLQRAQVRLPLRRAVALGAWQSSGWYDEPGSRVSTAG